MNSWYVFFRKCDTFSAPIIGKHCPTYFLTYHFFKIHNILHSHVVFFSSKISKGPLVKTIGWWLYLRRIYANRIIASLRK